VSAVLVTGGTGTFGRHAVRLLLERGHDPRVLSRRDRPALPAGVAAIRGDLATNAGVAAAVDGVELVLHAASDARKAFGKDDVKMTENLIAAARGARVEHLLYISIVGVDKIPYRYYRYKLACERLIESSGIRHAILRATQFHELAELILRRLERLPVAVAPLGVKSQLVAARECAERAVALLDEEPRGGLVEFGGPEVLTGRQIVDVWRTRRGRPRVVVPLPLFGASGRGFRAGLNTTPEHAGGRQTWAEFVAALE
jgi:uncharacterized protein YbjT (DUF2867 family)